MTGKMELKAVSVDISSSRLNSVCVLGAGDYGRAIGSRLLSGGYQVVFGSRDPNSRKTFIGQINPGLQNVPVASIGECVSTCDVIIMAINASNHHTLQPYADQLAGKILVDVSNPEKVSKDISQAEQLQAMYPSARVCKAFNTISAYALGEGQTTGGGQVVYVSSDHAEARGAVLQMGARMGLQAVDFGGLARARELEQGQHTLFLGWGWPSIVMALWLIFWGVYNTYRSYVVYSWVGDRWPINCLNRVTGCMAITMLAMCYIPGCIAAFLQLARGTKYQVFPAWLDVWLRMRKQLGLYGLLFAIIHSIMSLGIMEPAYFSHWFHSKKTVVPANTTQDVSVSLSSKMTWLVETSLLLGILTVAMYCILGITSLPSVGTLMNWREWRFVQSYMGHLCLFSAGAHVVVMCFTWWMSLTFVELLEKPPFLTLIFPIIALFCRLILWTPCVSSYLWRIRKGHVRGLKRNVESGQCNPAFEEESAKM